MNIVIVTTGHSPFDERIFYKIGFSLRKFNNEVAIICSNVQIDTISQGIKIKGFDGNSLSKKVKIKKLTQEIRGFNPSLIICCEPLAIPAAHRYKREKKAGVKIIDDITEYYPLRSTIDRFYGLNKLIHYVSHFIFNIYAVNLADYLFIGEEGKAGLYKFIAPTKSRAIIGYYPPLSLFRYSPPRYDGKHFTICYSGIISESRGFGRYLTLIKKIADLFPDKEFTALIIGKYESEVLRKSTVKLSKENIKVRYHDRVDYIKYSEMISETDICIDLRDKNSVFNRSLPIKAFDYMACGKPVIYSNLDSFKEFRDIENFGLLIEPDDLSSALDRIGLYLVNPDKLKEDSLAARKLFEEKYNWEEIEKKMTTIIAQLVAND